MNIGNDAALFPEHNTVPKAPLHTSSFSSEVREISNSLSSTDIKKLYFLCLDLIPPDQPCPQTIEELFSFINGDIDSIVLLKELLYHVKKYRLLKSLQTCRHKMKISLETIRYVRQSRLSLFHVCENIENEAVKQLKCLLGENSAVTEGWEAIAAEDFFRVWLREVDDDKIQLLKKALETMQHDQLAENLNCEESTYHMITPSCGKPCGLAVIFNHETFNKPSSCKYTNKTRNNKKLEERVGTNVDEENLCKLWTDFGFDVVVFKDKTYPDMMSIIDLLAKLNYSNYSAFICCILTHGDEGVVYTSDNFPVDIINEVIFQFNSTAAPSLKDKPKIFFIQACQGKNAQTITPSPTCSLQMDSSGFSMDTDNKLRDMLWLLSTVPRHMSFRETENGSWFINSLVEVLQRDGTRQSLSELLLSSVNSKVTRKSGFYPPIGSVTQTPLFYATTFRKFRFKRIRNNSGLSPRRVNFAEYSAVLSPILKFATNAYLV